MPEATIIALAPPRPAPTPAPGPEAEIAFRPLAEARGLRIERGGERLLNGVDLRIREGETTVIMGPNGAGKTLTLRALHGLIAPDSGSVSWRGRPLDRRARAAQAMVFQRPSLLRRSVAGNFRFALKARGQSRAERNRATELWLARAGLEAMARRPARLLSGGEQQRLATARALSLAPELLLLDEPTASLDPASTLALERMIAEARADGVTVVLVTHDAGQARRLADRAVFMARGRVVEETTAQAFFERPDSEPARAYLAGRIVL